MCIYIRHIYNVYTGIYCTHTHIHTQHVYYTYIRSVCACTDTLSGAGGDLSASGDARGPDSQMAAGAPPGPAASPGWEAAWRPRKGGQTGGSDVAFPCTRCLVGSVGWLERPLGVRSPLGAGCGAAWGWYRCRGEATGLAGLRDSASADCQELHPETLTENLWAFSIRL